MLDNEGYQKG